MLNKHNLNLLSTPPNIYIYLLQHDIEEEQDNKQLTSKYNLLSEIFNSLLFGKLYVTSEQSFQINYVSYASQSSHK